MWSIFLNVLFPRYCAGCRKIGTYLCSNCRRELRSAHNQQCIYCRRSTICGITHASCRKRHGVDAFVSILHYNTRLKRIIAQIKYHGYLEALTEVLWILQPPMRTTYLACEHARLINTQVSAIIPVPLHPSRMRERGFNQAEIVAQALSSVCNLPISYGLRRTKKTPQLAKLAHDNIRKAYVKNAFECTLDHVPRCAIIVDDIVTTGATATEAAKTLKVAGVERVIIFSLARG